MTYLADQFGGGLDPLQNFDLRSIPIEVRKGRFAARISGHDSAGRPIIEQDSVGDVRNAMMWEPSSRAIAAWSHAMPVVGGSPVNASGGNFSDPDLVAKEGGAGGNAAPGAGGGGPKAGDGLKWKKIGGVYYYYDKKNGTWRSGEYTVAPPPFGLNAPGGGAIITWPDGRQRDPGFGLNAPGGLYITYPKGGSGGQRKSGAVGPVGPAGAQGQGGAVGNAGPAGAIRPGARSITGEPGPSFQAAPIRGEYGEDGTIAPKSIGLPQGFPSLAGGSVGLVVGGTEHTYEAPVYLHGDPRLVSVNEGPDPGASSVVLDTDDRGRLNPNLSAPLHSAWRVIEPVFSRTATGARGTLAWQLARGERDGVAGFGAIVDTSVRGGSKPAAVTTGASQQGAGGSGGGTVGVQTGTGYKAGEAYTFIKGGANMGSPANPGIVYSPKSAGAAAPAAAGATKDDTPALCVGLTSARVGGPLEVGHGKGDKHKIGNSGSRAVNVAHVPVGALFFRDAVQDAPLDFEPGFMPKVAQFPMRAAVHLQYHAASTHSIPGKSGIPGLWKWWAEVPYTEEGGGRTPVPTPTDPPVREPKDPVPVDDPPVQEPKDPTVTPKPERPTTGKPKQGTPITDRDPNDPNPLGEPPASASGAGAAVGGRRKELLRDYDGTFETPGDGAIGSIPTASTYPSFAKPRSPGGKTDKTVVHPGVEAFTAQVWKPQQTDAATIDLRTSIRPGGDEIERQSRERPTTLRVEAYGGQTGGVFARTQTRGASRFVGGTGPGGVVYLPPEQDIMDVDRTTFVPTSSTSYVGHVPGVYAAFGKPMTSTGGWKSGIRIGADSSGNGIFSSMSSAGAATTALTIDPTGGVTLGAKFALAGVVSPAQITSNQNDYAPTGLSGASILRVSSDAARSITGLTGGADDRMLIVSNVGAYTITLKNEDVASTAANRFLFGADLALAAEESVWLTYDNTSARWRLVSRTTASSGGGVSDADYGDVVVSSSGTVWTIDAGVVTLAKMANLATDRLIGRDTAGTGVPEALTVGGGVEFTGAGGIQTSAFTGDVTKSAGGTALTIAADAVTYAKMQNVSATDKVLGRSTAGAGDPEEIACTAAGRALLDDATAADQRTTLGLGGAAVLAVGTTAGTVAAGDDSRFPEVIEPTDSATDIVSTASETSLWSEAIASMAAGDRIRVKLFGDYFNNNGAQTFTLRIKFGSTTIIAFTSPSIAANATRRAWALELELAAYATTANQRGCARFHMSAATAPTTGTGSFANLNAPMGSVILSAAATEDTTSSKTLEVTIQHSASSANQSFKIHLGTMQHLKA